MVEQVGGDHYKARVQHWDWVVMANLGYLEGCATKYVSRHHKKGGKEDLHKAVSYIDKIIEVYFSERYVNLSHFMSMKFHVRADVRRVTEEWIEEAKIPPAEAQICRNIAKWGKPDDLKYIIKEIRFLILEYES